MGEFSRVTKDPILTSFLRLMADEIFLLRESVNFFSFSSLKLTGLKRKNDNNKKPLIMQMCSWIRTNACILTTQKMMTFVNHGACN